MAVDVTTNTLSITNDLTANCFLAGTASSVASLRVGANGSIVVGGNSYLGNNGNIASIVEFMGTGNANNTTGLVTFKGNVTFGGAYNTASTTNGIGTMLWDGTGTQNIYTNSQAIPYMNANCKIGSVNTPTVIVSNTYNGILSYQSGHGLTINAGATLDLNTSQWNQNTANTGTLTVNGILKLADFFGGQTGSNFPLNYSVTTLASTSTVEYYGTTAQTIYATPTYGNLTLTNNATKTAGAALTIAGDLTINSTATMVAGALSHTLKGNMVNNGIFTANTSTISFASTTAAQTLSGSSTTTFYNLTLNNTSAATKTLTLSAPANVSNVLTLTSGLLNTDATNILTMQNASTAPALTAASTSYVNGPLMWQLSSVSTTTLNVPIGVGAECRPAKLILTHASVLQYNYQCQVFAANPWAVAGSVDADMPATCDTISGVHYWKIDRTNSLGAPAPSTELSGNQQIQLYFGANDGVYSGNSLTVVKSTSGTTMPWIDIGGTAYNTGGTALSNNNASAQAGSIISAASGAPASFNSFSYFTLGSLTSGGKDPLPIELLSFSAVPNEERVDVKWETSTETNNDYFTVEKSTDGKNFSKLIDVKGAGTSTSYKNYAEVDFQPYLGTSYYRLKQTDKNGQFKYFNMVPVTFNQQKSVVLYPNPIDNTANLSIHLQGYQNQEVVVVLRDMQGKEFLSTVLLSEKSNQLFVFDGTKSLAPGAYIVTASSNDKIYNYKLIVK